MKWIMLFVAVICITASMAYGVNMLIHAYSRVDAVWSAVSMFLYGVTGEYFMSMYIRSSGEK